MAKQDGGLFLLEVLVDKIIFVKSPCFSDRDFRTCVNIECSGVEPLEICDDDPSSIAKSNSPFVKTFNSGKSCLFSLKETDIASSMSKFPIKVTVHKSLPCGCLPTKIIMGECTIDMTKAFVEARQNFLKDPSKLSYQSLKDSFQIVGPDGVKTGDILMFLRISCFGKLIVTQFQGAPNLNMAGSSTVVDRSCTPKKDFQSLRDPCACGAARVPGHTDICPQAEDPYNSMPCEDPDEACYCSGSRGQTKQNMACRNTGPYCLHLPKGNVPRMPYYQELAKNESKKTTYSFRNGYTVKSTLDQCVFYLENSHHKTQIDLHDLAGIKTDPIRVSYLVYMTLVPNYGKYCNNGTQATASINKCFQVYENSNATIFPYNSNYSLTNSISTLCRSVRNIPGNNHYSQVYFFDEKKCQMQKGVGLKSCPGTRTKRPTNTYKPTTIANTTVVRTKDVNVNTSNTSNKAVTTKPIGRNINPKASKNVSIHENKPTNGTAKDNVIATISHIRIGPREVCPLHGNDLKCQVASSSEEQGQVKITNSNNPRRGVFELVIRRLTGAPLAKNELMLEWVPPLTQNKPCSSIGPVTFIPSGRCRQKCKMVLCRPSSCKGKHARKPCFSPCSSSSCKRCNKSPCYKACRQPSTCRPCPSPCYQCMQTCKIPCSTACKPNCTSPPCIKVCPVGRKKSRRGKSQPRVRTHPKYVSPCLNRSKTCPIVICRSVPQCCLPCCA